MSGANCGQCSFAMVAESGGRLPPWCPKCGADLKPAAADLRADAPAADGTPVPARTEDGVRDLPTLSGAQPPEKAENLDERFGVHNLLFGLGIAAGAFVLGFLLAADPSMKRLQAHQGLDRILTILQVVTLGNGLALFVSGIGIRQRQTWGYPLATVSAAVFIGAGLVFFAAFYYLTRFDGLENAVALFTFIRMNIDLVIGFVDGFGLLYFMNKHQQKTEKMNLQSRSLEGK